MNSALEAKTCRAAKNSYLVNLGLRGVASLHSHIPPALCSLVVAQLLHLQETYTKTKTLSPPQNWPNLYKEEGDATR